MLEKLISAVAPSPKLFPVEDVGQWWKCLLCMCEALSYITITSVGKKFLTTTNPISENWVIQIMFYQITVKEEWKCMTLLMHETLKHFN